MNRFFLGDMLRNLSERGLTFWEKDAKAKESPENLCILCERLIENRSDISSRNMALTFFQGYKTLDLLEKQKLFNYWLYNFSHQGESLKDACEEYLKDPSPANVSYLSNCSEPLRQALLRRLNQVPNGTFYILKMREDLLFLMKTQADLKPVDADFEHLLSSWFNYGFLIVKQIDWSCSAKILAKIIEYEAVHTIQSWDDLRHRIEPLNRRCFAFFHPALPDEPLIFVEVALSDKIESTIHQIIDFKNNQEIDHINTLLEKEILASFNTAIFYSISACQKGLKGISLGNFLIKHVVDELKKDIPSLQRFVTLSPVPNFNRWLNSHQDSDEDKTSDLTTKPPSPLKTIANECLDIMQNSEWFNDQTCLEQLQPKMYKLAAYYLIYAKLKQTPFDAVMRFHLSNGARLECINWLADCSEKGIANSSSLMVNYLYDLKNIEKNHDLYFSQNKVIAEQGILKTAKIFKQLVDKAHS